MRVHLGCDHAGFELKEQLLSWLPGKGHQPVDHGADQYDPEDDYPLFCVSAGEAVVADPGSFGIVLGGSGNGEQIAANKVVGVRAALVWNDETATLARKHNDANVASVGARMHSTDEALRLIRVFLDTPFSEETRHSRRIAILASYEETGTLPEPRQP
ncbi:MAG: ribose-5-phosphate isomerase [Nocardioidaceae bacterium]